MSTMKDILGKKDLKKIKLPPHEVVFGNSIHAKLEVQSVLEAADHPRCWPASWLAPPYGERYALLFYKEYCVFSSIITIIDNRICFITRGNLLSTVLRRK